MVVQQLSFWPDQNVTDHSSKSMRERGEGERESERERERERGRDGGRGREGGREREREGGREREREGGREKGREGKRGKEGRERKKDKELDDCFITGLRFLNLLYVYGSDLFFCQSKR